jgi:hypothetical protein
VKKGDGPNPNVPLYSYWKGKKLSYLEARREIYCPAYAQCVVKTKAYKKLEELLDDGVNVQVEFSENIIHNDCDQILGYDGYDYISEGKTLKDCFYDTKRPFGHELVLACLLNGERVWEESK